MKRILLTIVLAGFVASAWSQKIAFVDTEYILKNIPAYESAIEQINQLAKRYETDVKARFDEVAALYETYKNENVFLSADMKVKKENEIVEKEQAAKKLQQQYFGQDGDLFKRRETLIKPIQDQIYNAIAAIAAEKGLGAVFDKSSGAGLMWSDSKIDFSDEVLNRLGYKK
jgi:outer membrane protein